MLVILQARMSSKRLPGKVIKKINNVPMLLRVYDRLRISKKISHIIVATSISKNDQKVVSLCKRNKISYYCGNLQNVSERYKNLLNKIKKYNSFIRISGDSPLIDGKLIDKFISIYRKKKPDILTNVLRRSFPSGQSIEIIKTSLFLKYQKKFKKLSEKEHVTKFFYKNYKSFKILNIKNKENFSDINMSVDTISDLKKVRLIYKEFIDKKFFYYSWPRLLKFYNK